jgi:GT2 family glycosyltransferase
MDKERYPLISIGITCFNAIITIDRAITSALNQDWPNIEIIIVDDNSIDGTRDHIRKKWLANEKIRMVFNPENIGVGGSRNIIIKNAKGAFLAFFDDDDESLPERIRFQYHRIMEFENEKGAHLTACYTSRLQIFSNGATRIEPTLGLTSGNEPSGKTIVDLILLGKPIRFNQGSCAACTLMARKEVFETLEGFDSNILRGEDTDFNLSLGQKAGFLIGLDQILVHQYITNAADKSPEEEYRNALIFNQKHMQLFKERNSFIFSNAWISVKLLYRNRNFLQALVDGTILLIKFPAFTLRRVYWVLIRKYCSKQNYIL